MKKTLLLAALALTSVAAFAQDVFKREMPCKNDYGQVIANKMGTICLPYAAVPSDCSVYKLVSASAQEWIFQEVKSMEANTPYVFVVDNNTTLEASFTKVGEEIECQNPTATAAGVEGAFVGSYKRQIIRGQKMYFLSHDKINFNNGLPIVSTPYRGYFSADVMPEGETISEDLKLTFRAAADDGGTTALEAAEMQEEEVTTLSRQHVGLKQGNYSINGKKVVVK